MNNEKERKCRKILSPKLDVVFQALFGEEGNERITKDFLETILHKQITHIDLSKNTILRRDNLQDKLGILDIAVKINKNENCDVELQMVNEENVLERILFYWAKQYIRSIKKGQEYEKLEKSIVILISDKEINKLHDIKKYHSEWKIFETEERKNILTDKFEIHIIELEKIKGEEQKNERLLDWLTFLNNPESERVKEKMEENSNLKEAKEKLNKISEDEKMQQLAWWREKAIYEENTRINAALRKGQERGRDITIKETAKKMKNENIEIELIIKITGLTKEEIEKL